MARSIRRFSLVAVLACAPGLACASGFGALRLQSGLGQQLKAQLEVVGDQFDNLHGGCFKARVENADGTFLAAGQVLYETGGARPLLLITTKANLQEPAVKVVVDVACEAHLHREFLILLDPPHLRPELLSAGVGAEVNEDAARPAAAASRATPQRSTPEAVAPGAAGQADASAPAPRARKGKRRAVKDALRLSDDVTVLPQGLRISDQLSLMPGSFDAGKMRELRAAQAQLAAYLRDEELRPLPAAVPASAPAPVPTLGPAEKAALQAELEQLRRQNQKDKATLEDLKDGAGSRNWITALAGLIAVATVMIAALLLYIGRLHKKMASNWWAQNPEQQPESAEPKKKNIEELVDNVQASYGPIAADTNTQPLASTEPLKAVATTAPRKIAAAVGLDPLERRTQPNRTFHAPSLEDSNSSTFNFFSTRGNSVKVEEISDVTQEAEFWMSVNDPQRAIEILEPQTLIEQPDSPVPWLYLLDLYRITADKVKYDALRDRFIVFFNANIPEFESEPDEKSSRHLDDFEHLAQKICTLWKTHEALPFLQSLLIDDRDGKRMGFDLPVYRDILLLIGIAHELERNGFKRKEDYDAINFETIDFKPKTER